jgi:biotin synthase
MSAVKFAHDKNYGSVVLQSGERNDKQFIEKVERLLKKIYQISNGELGVTLSLGEQTKETYKRWQDSGARRYLLRIESTNKELFYKIHPNDEYHNFEKRLEALQTLNDLGYQTGTGVMIGLPHQTIEDLANDLLFFKNNDIDMVGMGPYIEHSDTPMFSEKHLLLPLNERFNLSLKMIAILRILMKDINIAAATALQAIDPIGREKAIKIGANIIMPNITPTENRKNYLLYQNKPCTDEGAEDCTECLEARIYISGDEIGYGKSGDSKHFFSRMKK